jgi:hypothetical protein
VRDACAKHLAIPVFARNELAVNVLVEVPSRPSSQAGDMPDLRSHCRSRRFKSGHLHLGNRSSDVSQGGRQEKPGNEGVAEPYGRGRTGQEGRGDAVHPPTPV